MNACAKLFVDYLKSQDFNYEVREIEDGCVVTFPSKGKLAQCFFNGDDGQYLSIYMTFESVPKDKYASAIIACNQVNTEYKWVTAYIDKDMDIILHLDARLSLSDAAEEAFEMLVRFFNIYEKIKPVLMKAIYG